MAALWKQLRLPATQNCSALLGAQLNSSSHQPLCTLMLTPFSFHPSMSTAILSADERLHAASCVTVNHWVRLSRFLPVTTCRSHGALGPLALYMLLPRCAPSAEKVWP